MYGLICRVCSVEKKIRREKRWAAIGKCPHCKEQHTLFRVTESTINRANKLLTQDATLLAEDAHFYALEEANENQL
jgi:hypothetical protein